MTQSVNGKFCGLKRAVGGMYLILLATFLGYDYTLYRAIIKSDACCGYVDSKWYKRPVTHFMIDNWSKPVKSTSGSGGYIQEGVVDGVAYFWTFANELDG